jgi:hypothetical protein
VSCFDTLTTDYGYSNYTYLPHFVGGCYSDGMLTNISFKTMSMCCYDQWIEVGADWLSIRGVATHIKEGCNGK